MGGPLLVAPNFMGGPFLIGNCPYNSESPLAITTSAIPSPQKKGFTMVLLEFSMYPLDKGASVAKYVARSLEIIDESGLDYQCHAMGTVIEGEFDEVFGVVRQCFERMKEDCDRIECSIQVDYRKGATGRIRGKVSRVEEELGRPVKK